MTDSQRQTMSPGQTILCEGCEQDKPAETIRWVNLFGHIQPDSEKTGDVLAVLTTSDDSQAVPYCTECFANLWPNSA